MLDFSTALKSSRTLELIEDINRVFLAAYLEGTVSDEDAEAIDAAISEARQRIKTAEAARAANPSQGSKPRRKKVFGNGGPRPMDRNLKLRIMVFARTLMRRTQAGKAYGALTAKAIAVLQALLWEFHNAASGLCYPSYETIAKNADCARSTVDRALKALEAAGILSWVNRIVRRRVSCGVLGSRIRVMRNSNAYTFTDPCATAGRPESSKSDFRSGTNNQGSFSLSGRSTLAAAAQLNTAATAFWTKIEDFETMRAWVTS